tara:strand:- start:72 stop:557 length:486 start_codon:yes stop_codon:yes gene_type:complete
MDGKKISQIGATNEGVAFLRKLAGRSEESGAKRDEEIAPTAPFKEMKDAYRVLFIYGLIKGERLSTKSGQSFSTIYANVNMLTDSFDYHTLLQTFGNKEDLDDIGKAINEYTNWAIEEIRDDYSPDSFDLHSEFEEDSDDDDYNEDELPDWFEEAMLTPRR